MRGFEGEEVVISQHEPAKVDSRRVNQVRMLVVKDHV